MARLNNEPEPYEEDLFDFLGKKIEPGSKIVYASLLGRSAKLTLGEVIGIYKPRNTSGYSSKKFSIKVQPLKDSVGGSWRFTEGVRDPVTGKYERVEKEARPVNLQFSDRLMVLE